MGSDTAAPVSDDYQRRNSKFRGEVNLVEITLGEDAKDADHYISPEERMRVARVIQ